MRKDYHFYVYIISSRSRTFYIGVTGSLLRRIQQHREGNADSFTAKYRIHRLVYFKEFAYADNAIRREKELKGWLRQKKLALINTAMGSLKFRTGICTLSVTRPSLSLLQIPPG